MKIVFFGSPAFACPFLQALIDDEGVSVIGAVTQPDKPKGRSGTPTPCAVASLAKKAGIPLLQPASKKALRGMEPNLAALEADVFVVIAYGKILPASTLAIPPKGVVNVHPSLLPLHRGPTPMQAAILHGDKETGVSIMLMDEEMDHGPILRQESFPLPTNMDYPALQVHVESVGPKWLTGALHGYVGAQIHPQPQNHAEATFCSLLSRDSGRIDWKSSAAAIERMIRAYRPWPGTWTTWNEKTLKIHEAQVGPQKNLPPGQILLDNDHVLVGCGDGTLQLEMIQLEGSRTVPIKTFLNGHPDFIGSILR